MIRQLRDSVPKSSLMNIKRHPATHWARTLTRDKLCPSLFALWGGDVYDMTSPVPGVETKVSAPATEIDIPPLNDACSGDAIPGRVLNYPTACVHRIDSELINVRLLRSGGVLLPDKRLISCGVHPHASMWDALFCRTSHERREEVLVVPWAHPWYTFGDFMTHILPILCRIISETSRDLLQRAVVVLPKIDQRPWAIQFLELLGFEREQLVDSETVRIGPAHSAQIITGSGIPFETFTAHPHDYALLRKQFASYIEAPRTKQNLYLQRKTRRRYVHEEKILGDLKELGYLIVDEREQSARDQVLLFASASKIVGPHGAAFANTVFSSRCAVFEFQHAKWVEPCYRYISELLGFDYSLAVDRRSRLSTRPTLGYQLRDIDVNPQQLRQALRSFTEGVDAGPPH